MVHHRIDERYAQYPPSCQAGDLTIEGMMEHLNLGKSFRRYLVDDLKFLPEKMDPKHFQFISSNIDRCFRSAESFLTGFYKPENPNEVLNIQTGDDGSSTLVATKDACKELSESLTEFENGEEMAEKVNETCKYVMGALHGVGRDECSYNNVHDLCSWTATMSCSNNTMPDFMTQEVIDKCNEFNGFLQFNQYNDIRYGPGIAASYIMRNCFSAVDDSIAGGNGKKFTLLSAHDTTLSAVLVLLGNVNKYMPPFASYLAMEIWKDKDQTYYVRYVFNGEPVNIKYFNKTIVRYDDFRYYISPLIDYCHDFPK